MCGIIGYAGHRPCTKIIYQGLQRLEYRGYDSAGIAVSHRGEIGCIKSEGKLSQLKPLLSDLPSDANVGMGHTRWATHGPPTTQNAHPHVFGELAMIHNGIIENYQELREVLIGRGVSFVSDTDTEVVLHLLQAAFQQHGNPKDALIQTLAKLEGAFSLGVMFASEPEAIYVVKEGTPIVIAQNGDESYFASDATALIEHCPSAVFLNDGEFARIEAGKMDIWDFNGKPVKHLPTQLSGSASSLEKRGYRHYMLKEIHEQPSVMAQTISRLTNGDGAPLTLEDLGLEKLDIGRIQHVFVVACGTAFHAGMMAKYLLESRMDLPVSVELASEFRYRNPVMHPQTLVISISQSGETADTLACVRHASDAGCQTLSICNVKYSSIPRQSTSTLYMEAGPEIGVASTKAFTSMIACIHLVGLAIASKRDRLTPEQSVKLCDPLRALPHLVERTLGAEKEIERIAGKFYESTNFLYIGRGLNFPLALEGALKLKEISYIHAEGYAGGELKHGPIALVDRHMPIIAIAPKDRSYDKMISNIEEVRAREGCVIGIGHENDSKLKGLCSEFIGCPPVDDATVQSILVTIPLQLFSYYVAVKRGTDVDQPRNLAKSVTVE